MQTLVVQNCKEKLMLMIFLEIQTYMNQNYRPGLNHQSLFHQPTSYSFTQET